MRIPQPPGFKIRSNSCSAQRSSGMYSRMWEQTKVSSNSSSTEATDRELQTAVPIEPVEKTCAGTIRLLWRSEFSVVMAVGVHRFKHRVGIARDEHNVLLPVPESSIQFQWIRAEHHHLAQSRINTATSWQAIKSIRLQRKRTLGNLNILGLRAVGWGICGSMELSTRQPRFQGLHADTTNRGS
jgi:hypothetical protein